MTSLKKKQHYVWRHYLKAWASNEKIWALLKSRRKIIESGLMGVAQERYFYELIDFDDKEEGILEKFIKGTSHDSVKALNLDFLHIFTSHYKLKKQLIDSGVSGSNKEFIEQRIKEMEINLMEDAHSKMEDLGNQIIGCAISYDYKFLEDNDAFFETIMFLCFQYVRTKKMKKAIEKSFENHKTLNMPKMWNIISYSFATTLASSLSFNSKIKFLFYENNSKTKFLTSDQPIMNILGDTVDESGNTKEFEWYYPLSPKLALLIHLRDAQKLKVESESISEKQINYLNKKMIEYAEEFIFADNQDQLQLITNLL